MTIDTHRRGVQDLPPRRRRPTASAGGAAVGRRRQFLFLRNSKAITGLAILGFFLLIAIIGPWIAPYDPERAQ